MLQFAIVAHQWHHRQGCAVRQIAEATQQKKTVAYSRIQV